MATPSLKKNRKPVPEGFGHDMTVAWDQALRGFSLAFACRSSLSVLLRLLQLARRGQLKQIFSIENVFSEKTLVVRVEAVRIGLAVGCFSGGYEFITRFLIRYWNITRGINSMIAGFFSAISLLFLNAEDRRMVSLYAMARASQCTYNLLKSRGMWHFWGSDWNHGDALLFATSTAQVMYAYVMRPLSLPTSYYKFIQRTGPITEEVLGAVRRMNRGNGTTEASRVIVGCDKMHPMCTSCTFNTLRVLLSSFKKILPVYGSLSLISIVIVGFVRFVRNPMKGLIGVVTNTLQSSLFLASLVAIYQSVICVHRKMVSKDHRFIYWFSGWIAGGASVLIEKKSRRSELALYVLPRALDSFYTVLYDRRWLGSVPQGELPLFCLSCCLIMYGYDHEPDSLSPLLNWVLGKVMRRSCTGTNGPKFDSEQQKGPKLERGYQEGR
eukprot:TRINITY_DN5930_c0_g1_i9.p1 TRINITY_DN5930_c0_g1~~TRINITY_DN5930_c0_g1_i9.p1  ORF type:complete len:459 (+),score=84.42 TRINITY_DN5930_c0_g1_i9:63-1379(+)